jgi:hypothetical protein
MFCTKENGIFGNYAQIHFFSAKTLSTDLLLNAVGAP